MHWYARLLEGKKYFWTRMFNLSQCNNKDKNITKYVLQVTMYHNSQSKRLKMFIIFSFSPEIYPTLEPGTHRGGGSYNCNQYWPWCF